MCCPICCLQHLTEHRTAHRAILVSFLSYSLFFLAYFHSHRTFFIRFHFAHFYSPFSDSPTSVSVSVLPIRLCFSTWSFPLLLSPLLFAATCSPVFFPPSLSLRAAFSVNTKMNADSPRAGWFPASTKGDTPLLCMLSMY